MLFLAVEKLLLPLVGVMFLQQQEQPLLRRPVGETASRTSAGRRACWPPLTSLAASGSYSALSWSPSRISMPSYVVAAAAAAVVAVIVVVAWRVVVVAGVGVFVVVVLGVVCVICIVVVGLGGVLLLSYMVV